MGCTRFGSVLRFLPYLLRNGRPWWEKTSLLSHPFGKLAYVVETEVAIDAGNVDKALKARAEQS